MVGNWALRTGEPIYTWAGYISCEDPFKLSASHRLNSQPAHEDAFRTDDCAIVWRIHDMRTHPADGKVQCAEDVGKIQTARSMQGGWKMVNPWSAFMVRMDDLLV